MNSDANVIVADSSSVETAAAPTPIAVEDMNPDGADYANFLKTGEVPAKETKPTSDSASKDSIAQPEQDKSEASQKVKTVPDSESGEAEDPDYKNFGPKAQKRIKQLLARSKQAEATLAAERSARSTQKEAPKQATENKAPEVFNDEEPTIETFNGDWPAYAKAHSEWSGKKAVAEHEQKIKSESLFKSFQEREKNFAKRRGVEITGRDLEQELRQRITDPTKLQWLGGTLYIRDRGLETINYLLHENPAELEELLSLPPDASFASRIRDIELLHDPERLAELVAKSKALLEDSGDEPTIEAPKPKPKLVSGAFPPPREVGGKGTAPEDEEAGVIKQAKDGGDPTAYLEFAKKRDIAKRKAGRL